MKSAKFGLDFRIQRIMVSQLLFAQTYSHSSFSLALLSTSQMSSAAAAADDDDDDDDDDAGGRRCGRCRKKVAVINAHDVL